MTITLDQIQAPIAIEMTEFEQKFRASMQTRQLLLDKIMGYIVKRKGKQIRPMFVFFTAKISGGDPLPEASFRGAALIELLHTATLVHDDVVDESNYRRGFFSINALWKNKIAVLVGDYLLSRGMALALENDDFDLLKIVNNAVKELSEGELLQIEKARRLDITEDIYFDIIRQKTASLIASCCAVGAASAGANKETVERARFFGEKVGMAFQIKDDLFDFGTAEIGKPVRDFRLRDLTDKNKETYHTLSQYRGKKAVVAVFLSNRCGTTWQYEERMGKLMQDMVGKDVVVLGIHSNVNESQDEIRKYVETRNFAAPVLDDKEKNEFVTYFDARVTPTVLVIDKEGVLRYKGSYDDNADAKMVKTRYAEDAVNAVLTGKAVPVTTTRAFG